MTVTTLELTLNIAAALNLIWDSCLSKITGFSALFFAINRVTFSHNLVLICLKRTLDGHLFVHWLLTSSLLGKVRYDFFRISFLSRIPELVVRLELNWVICAHTGHWVILISWDRLSFAGAFLLFISHSDAVIVDKCTCILVLTLQGLLSEDRSLGTSEEIIRHYWEICWVVRGFLLQFSLAQWASCCSRCTHTLPSFL